MNAPAVHLPVLGQSQAGGGAADGPAAVRRFWRSLAELEHELWAPDWLANEFSTVASEWRDGPSRRRFLQLMGASIALASLPGCRRQPQEKIVPYVRDPERLVPGTPEFYATVYRHRGLAQGILVESHDGRPTKIEGNPGHPQSLGATSTLAQAHVLSLYDPDRSQAVRHLGEIRKWARFVEAVRAAMERQAESGGAGLRLLTEPCASPTLAAQMQALLKKYPQARWHQYEPINSDHAREGARLAFGQALRPRYALGDVSVGLAVDDDFLFADAENIRLAREFAHGRRVRRGTNTMSRWYSLDTHATITGASGDERLPIARSRVREFMLALAQRLGVLSGLGEGASSGLSEHEQHWLEMLAGDLESNRGSCVITVGHAQSPEVHALVHHLNAHLGAVGRAVEYAPLPRYETDSQRDSLAQLVEDMNSGEVSLLLILDGNPAYAAPGGIGFAQAMRRVETVVHVGLHVDETAKRSQWHVPLAHDLETWSDCVAADGTASIVQPLIEPLYFSRSLHQVLAVLLDEPSDDAHQIVQDHWKRWWSNQSGPEVGAAAAAGEGTATAFERQWRRWLHDGWIPGTRFDAVSAQLESINSVAEAMRSAAASPAAPSTSGIEIQFAPDYSVWDGRFANSAWLQEIPRPLTKITWDNALLISPDEAKKRSLDNGDIVEISAGERRLETPVWIAPGHPDGAATLHLGYGRDSAGRVGDGVGVDVYPLVPTDGSFVLRSAQLRRTGRRHLPAATAEHHLMEGRDIVRVSSLEEFLLLGEGVGEQENVESAPLYPDTPEGYGDADCAWGMSIDLTTCIGCNACTIACQAENNIPVVGREQVRNGREMHWIRVDGYFEGEPDNPQVHHQPVPCMQCEKAPCEVVCPVGATAHSDEGLNDMVYNRCVGTRYCSNNCPYKVRRFNFLSFNNWDDELQAMQHNPNVSVRSTGVMEKCTYCVQRISMARIAARKEDRPIRDGEVVTACQAVCPTQAIVFGNLKDKKSHVAQVKDQPHDYTLLAELNTLPRTTYLARITNPNRKSDRSGPYGG